LRKDAAVRDRCRIAGGDDYKEPCSGCWTVREGTNQKRQTTTLIMADEKIETPPPAWSDSESGGLAPQDAKSPSIVDEKNALPGVASIDTDRDLDGNPFSDPDVAAYWISVYEKSHYECRHVVDPKLEWTAAEERKLVRKLNWHVCLWAVSLVNFVKW
jgi:hypothetical protein